MSQDIYLENSDATATLAASLAHTAPEHAVVFLDGELGAGKSTLARAWLRSMGVTGPIKSPTYALVERYPLPVGEAAHLDLYRLAAASELDFLGLDEIAAEATLWLVEWPERGQGSLPPPDLWIRLAVEAGGRRARVEPASPAGVAWLQRAALPWRAFH